MPNISNVRPKILTVLHHQLFTMTRLFFLVSAFATLFLAGCASALKMPLHADNDRVASSGKTIYLMSVTLQNSCRDHFTPEFRSVQIVRNDGAAKPEITSFAMDSKGTHSFEDRNLPPRYLVRFELPSGDYLIRGLASTASGFPIRASFFTPLHSLVPSGLGSVVYLGAVNANIRPRIGNEFKAGPSLPLIDQAVACGSTGTFDVEIGDAFDADMPSFKESFTQLKDVSIAKSILPPFDRAKAQRWWEDN